jgi:two-component system, OmpR family, sensor histidine kinase BaeS
LLCFAAGDVERIYIKTLGPLTIQAFSYLTDEARTRNWGGTGLGLAIAKEFVLAHDGTIDVESTLGQRITFIVKLPY